MPRFHRLGKSFTGPALVALLRGWIAS